MQNKTNPLVIVLTVVITALVVGSVFYFLNQKSTEALNDNKTTSTEVTASDKRVLISQNEMYKYIGSTKCEDTFNSDIANTVVPYSNSEKGIEFNIPYNENWGNEKYKIDAFWETDKYITFGSIYSCGSSRTDSVELLPQISAEEVITELQKKYTPEEIIVPPTIQNINGLTVVKYATAGYCSYPVLQIIGQKYNYAFQPPCGMDSLEKDFEYLEKLVKTAKLI